MRNEIHLFRFYTGFRLTKHWSGCRAEMRLALMVLTFAGVACSSKFRSSMTTATRSCMWPAFYLEARSAQLKSDWANRSIWCNLTKTPSNVLSEWHRWASSQLRPAHCLFPVVLHSCVITSLSRTRQCRLSSIHLSCLCCLSYLRLLRPRRHQSQAVQSLGHIADRKVCCL